MFGDGRLFVCPGAAAALGIFAQPAQKNIDEAPCPFAQREAAFFYAPDLSQSRQIGEQHLCGRADVLFF